MEPTPKYVRLLQEAYGPPSQSGFGSAVFFEQIEQPGALEQAALEKYKYFVGVNWERFGEPAWMSDWKQTYARQADTAPDIVAEMQGISDPGTKLSVPMILEIVENPRAARQALARAFNDPGMVDLRVYNLGDGAAMSGLLIAGRHTNGEATFLVFLLD